MCAGSCPGVGAYSVGIVTVLRGWDVADEPGSGQRAALWSGRVVAVHTCPRTAPAKPTRRTSRWTRAVSDWRIPSTMQLLPNLRGAVTPRRPAKNAGHGRA